MRLLSWNGILNWAKFRKKKNPGTLERVKKKWPAAIVIGILLGAIVYFVNGSRSFLTYKNALAEGTSVEQAAGMCMRWASYMTLPDVLMILLLYLPLLMILYMTVRGKYGIPRKALFINAGYIVLMVVLQVILRNWKWVGILGASESLLEGCIYVNLVIYWNQKMARSEAM